MTVVDFDSLQASEGPRVTLLPGTIISAPIVGSDFSDFSVFASVFVACKAGIRDGSRGQPSLTVLVEQSDDGMSWSTAATFSYGADGVRSASLSSPKAHLRASAHTGGGSEWQIVYVTASPTYLDPASVGGDVDGGTP